MFAGRVNGRFFFHGSAGGDGDEHEHEHEMKVCGEKGGNESTIGGSERGVCCTFRE